VAFKVIFRELEAFLKISIFFEDIFREIEAFQKHFYWNGGFFKSYLRLFKNSEAFETFKEKLRLFPVV
jgi:hypothetical protein